jgi:hypothetical protein
MIDAIEYLKGCGWPITLHDIGDDRPCLVLAVKCLPNEMWYLGRQCLEDDLDMGAAMYSTRDGVAYFPALVVDADAYRVIMS